MALVIQEWGERWQGELQEQFNNRIHVFTSGWSMLPVSLFFNLLCYGRLVSAASLCVSNMVFLGCSSVMRCSKVGRHRMHRHSTTNACLILDMSPAFGMLQVQDWTIGNRFQHLLENKKAKIPSSWPLKRPWKHNSWTGKEHTISRHVISTQSSEE